MKRPASFRVPHFRTNAGGGRSSRLAMGGALLRLLLSSLVQGKKTNTASPTALTHGDGRPAEVRRTPFGLRRALFTIGPWLCSRNGCIDYGVADNERCHVRLN